MLQLNTYLNFNGNAEEAFRFYQTVLGGELFVQYMSDVPFGAELPEHEKKRAMHVSLRLKEGIHLMASDILESAGHKLREGNNYYISIQAGSREEADRVFKGLSEGGKIEMPMEDMFWGDYFGSLADRFGIQWMVNHSPGK